MATLFCLRRVTTCSIRIRYPQNVWIAAQSYSKPTGKKPLKDKLEELKEKDPHRLVNYLCGGNIYKEGEDPMLKPPEEYPDWLWKLRTVRESPELDELEPGSWEYWSRMKKISLKEKNRQLSIKKKRKMMKNN